MAHESGGHYQLAKYILLIIMTGECVGVYSVYIMGHVTRFQADRLDHFP